MLVAAALTTAAAAALTTAVPAALTTAVPAALTTAVAAPSATAAPAARVSRASRASRASHVGQGREYQKSIAVRVLKGVFERGDTTVVDRFVRPDYIQHNPLAPDGADTLKSLGTAVHRQFPDTRYDVKRVLSDGDLVLMHSHLVLTPDTRATAVFDIFRFQGGRIAEHWDTGQNVPESTVSGNDMFSTLSSPRTDIPGSPGSLCDTEANRRLVTAFFDKVLVGHDLSAADRYISADTYYQHDPGFGDGLKDFKADFGDYFAQFPHALTLPKRVLAEGDLVSVHNHAKTGPDDRGNAVGDLFRVRNGKIVEHWDVTQAVPETSANDNTMF